jgi:hypothetical protein
MAIVTLCKMSSTVLLLLFNFAVAAIADIESEALFSETLAGVELDYYSLLHNRIGIHQTSMFIMI